MWLHTTFRQVCASYFRTNNGKVIELYIWSDISGMELRSQLVVLYSPLRLQKSLNKQNGKTEKVRAHSSSASCYLADQSAVTRGVSSIFKSSTLLDTVLYDINRVAIGKTISVFGRAFLLEFAVILKDSFAIDEIQSGGGGTGLKANFQWVFDRDTELWEEETHPFSAIPCCLSSRTCLGKEKN